jgi:hypothetical protein
MNKDDWFASTREHDDILAMAVEELHERACRLLRSGEVVYAEHRSARRGSIEVWGNATSLVEVKVVLPGGESTVVYAYRETGDCRHDGSDMIYATLQTMRKEMTLDDLANA